MKSNELVVLALEFASWLGFGVCLIVAIIALIARFATRGWHRARGIVDDDETVIRWFRASGSEPGTAELGPEHRAWLDGRREVEIFYRDRHPERIRFTLPRSHARALTWVALGFLALGVGTSVAQLVVLEITG